MEIAHQQQDDVRIVKLAGRLDSAAALSLETGFAAALSDVPPRIAVDMSRLDYISSAGLRVLLVIAKKVQQAQGGVALCGLTPGVREVFSVSGFDTIFAILPDAAAAIAAVRRTQP